MKVFIFAFYCLGLFFVRERGSELALVYFSYLPLAFLALFYFYDAGEYFFFWLSLALLFLGYFVSFRTVPLGELGLAAGATLGIFGLGMLYRLSWQQRVREDEKRWDQARAELEELKKKRQVRLESLRHLEKQVASLINLFEIARDFNECLDFRGTAQILFKKVLPEVPFERAELILMTPGKNPLQVAKVFAINRLGAEEKEGVAEEAPEREWIQKALQQKGLVQEGDLCLFPLMSEGEPSALFAIQGSEKEDLAKFEVLASQLSLQVRKIRLYEMVKELSIIDGLTGVLVRRHFLERFEEELRRALSHRFPLAVLMLDIDHFKRYNDEYGHLIGDMTLREVAQVIVQNVRNVDLVARYGGEEFVIVTPESQQAAAQEVAERIRSAVARRSFRGFEEETKVTVSIGVSVFPQDVPKSTAVEYDRNLLFELLQRSDRALYTAKEEGRNRVVTYGSVKKS